jgi:hypothetical protein
MAVSNMEVAPKEYAEELLSSGNIAEFLRGDYSPYGGYDLDKWASICDSLISTIKELKEDTIKING